MLGLQLMMSILAVWTRVNGWKLSSLGDLRISDILQTWLPGELLGVSGSYGC